MVAGFEEVEPLLPVTNARRERSRTEFVRGRRERDLRHARERPGGHPVVAFEEHVVRVEQLAVERGFEPLFARLDFQDGLRPDVRGLAGINFRGGIARLVLELGGLIQRAALIHGIHLLNARGRLRAGLLEREGQQTAGGELAMGCAGHPPGGVLRAGICGSGLFWMMP